MSNAQEKRPQHAPGCPEPRALDGRALCRCLGEVTRDSRAVAAEMRDWARRSAEQGRANATWVWNFGADYFDEKADRESAGRSL